MKSGLTIRRIAKNNRHAGKNQDNPPLLHADPVKINGILDFNNTSSKKEDTETTAI